MLEVFLYREHTPRPGVSTRGMPTQLRGCLAHKKHHPTPYRGTSLIRKRRPLGPYRRTMPMALWWSWGGVLFLMSEVPL